MSKNPTILGIHIGHDASATILKDGKIVGHALRERHSKIRHHLGIDRQTIEMAIQKSGLTTNSIDAIALTATQQIPSVINDSDYFCFTEDAVEKKLNPFRLIDNPYWKNSEKFVVERWRGSGPDWVNNFLKARGIDSNYSQINTEFLGILSPIFGASSWLNPHTISSQYEKITEQINSKILPGNSLESFHFPVTARLGNRSIPGYFVNHHVAHAASSFYSSPIQNSLIFTHDGGTGLDSGFYFLGSDSKITCLMPHYLECGQFYDYVASKLGLGILGGAGKLMGLAPYGSGALDGFLPVGTILDWRQWLRLNNVSSNEEIYEALFLKLVDLARSKGLDTSKIGNPAHILSGAPAEIAHAVQNLLETSIQSSVMQTADAIRHKGLTDHADYLCLSGGVALNCPANSKLWEAGRFKQIHIEPHCEDGGLSIGAANYVLHHFYDGQKKNLSPLTSKYAMMGMECNIDIPTVLHHYKERIIWQALDNWQTVAADAIADNSVVAIYCESYETGPRALGQRSILANPTDKKNWEKVNLIKRRELWRPFAPAVLATDVTEWFESGPFHSPFMLFTHKLLECRRGQVPAVTHIDGTARVQTVTCLDEPLYTILLSLKRLGCPPIVLNTSFNGPGLPIVQDPYDAIEMLIQSEIDFLFINGYWVRKNYDHLEC